MKTLGMWMMLMVLTAAPAFAQWQPHGYVVGAGGFAVSTDTTSDNVLGEVGIKIARGLSVFGDVGRFHNLQPSVEQPTVDNTTALLGTSLGLNVTGTARVPALYSIGGLRYAFASGGRVAPYVLAGVGVARLEPTAQFTFTSGNLPDGTTPSVGTDVTNQVIATGEFSAPLASTAWMTTVGGGVQIPVGVRWAIDAGYRWSRVSSDTPVNAQGATFGFGYRF